MITKHHMKHRLVPVLGRRAFKGGNLPLITDPGTSSYKVLRPLPGPGAPIAYDGPLLEPESFHSDARQIPHGGK
jgi:hypothetical protein